tara:strand:+ start:54 stop:995 length:942 start_codon:yes stop_codon:yes gene_type:complete
MASTYSPLGVEYQATGENAGTWGTKTNTNLEIVEQIAGGFTTQAVSDSGDTTLSVSDGSTGATLAHRTIEFTGSLTASRNVTIPNDVQNFYILKNSTSGSQNVVFKYASGTGTSATVPNGKVVLALAQGEASNPNITLQAFGGDVVDDTSPQLGGNLDTNSFMIDFDDAHGIRDENGNEQLIFETTGSAVNHVDVTNAATGSGPQIGAVGGDTNINLRLRPKATGLIEVMGATNPGSIQLNCESNSHGIKLTSPPHSVSQSYEIKFPEGNITAGTFLKVNSITGSGTTAVGQLTFDSSPINTGKAIAMAFIFG